MDPDWIVTYSRARAKPGTTAAIAAAQYAYMVSSDFESPEVRYTLCPYTPVDPNHALLTILDGLLISL